ncbi:MAG TPA: MOSC domain-containing protein [Candidatus Saccharimonadales bacterium]|nr:MOSC domain-containing protein [Candidatus Saccharimonadales bacterium]
MERRGEPVMSGFIKEPVRGPVVIDKLGLRIDKQADESVHGGENKAIYGFPGEHLPELREWLQARNGTSNNKFGEPLEAGSLGANFRLKGLLEDEVFEGDRFEIVSPGHVRRGATLVARSPREPCFKASELFPGIADWMINAAKPGIYFGVQLDRALKKSGATIYPGDRLVPVERRSITEIFYEKMGKNRKL